MSEPFFSVGEEVTLVSKLYPELNGDVIITEAVPSAHKVHSDGSLTSSNCGYGYAINYVTPSPSGRVCQCSLRKKHKGSGNTNLDEVTKSLNKPEEVR